MISLLELVAQNQPHFQTHKALLVLGLQNDFIQPDGKLPVNPRDGYLDRIHTLIPAFRQQSSNVIWIKTIYEADRLASDPATGEGDAVVVGGLVDADDSTDDDDHMPKDLPPVLSKSLKHKNRALDLLKRVSARRRTLQREEIQSEVAEAESVATEEDEELFLRQSARAGPACQSNTPGADFVDAIKPDIEKTDTVVQTTHYSAFQGTSLLLILRARLVTELYICGCITNVSVLATVVDAARHGIKINVVGDCLGYRKRSRHALALKRMEDFFDANIISSDDVLNPKLEADGDEDPSSSQRGNSENEELLQSLVDRLHLSDPNASSASTRQHGESPRITVNGQQRKPSVASFTENRSTALDDEQFAEKLAQGAKPSGQERKPDTPKQSMVKSKIRMRSRSDKSKKEEPKKSKSESSKKNDPKEASPRHSTVAERTTETLSLNKARPTSLTKAGSSDKLRDSPKKVDRSLKSSVSQPALSLSNTKEKSSASRVRLALSRSPKSDSNKDLAAPPSPSPARSTTTLSSVASGQATEKIDNPDKTNMGKSKLQSLATFPTLGPDDRIGEGDSRILYDFFPPELHHPSDRSKPLKDIIFTQLYNEVRWQKMLHQQGEVPRLVCCQGEFGVDGSMPVYRHPTDHTLPLLHFSPKVQVIRKQAEKLVGHPLNHVLIQLYRSGNDYISEHSDKTLDIVKGSFIVNVSFGAQRTMRLRTKRPAKPTDDKDDDDKETTTQRETQRVAMPHNSMFVLGLTSNQKWLHGIMPDKRLPLQRSDPETAYSGIRISLTFRHIGTFLDASNSVIWGQGATSKTHDEACDVINNDAAETERLVKAFGQENQSATFPWDDVYGEGFDVLHMHEPPADLPILFATANTVDTSTIRIFLSEKKIAYTLCPAPSLAPAYESNRQVSYRDADPSHTEISIHVPILMYLDRYYPLDTSPASQPTTALAYDVLIQTSALLKFYHNRGVPGYQKEFEDVLDGLEEQAALEPGAFAGRRRFSIADCQMWPALDEIIGGRVGGSGLSLNGEAPVEKASGVGSELPTPAQQDLSLSTKGWDGWTEERFPRLTEYYRMLWKRKKAVRELRAELPRIRKVVGDDVSSSEEEDAEL
jgi:nicotinamidase-related amidase/alkylated DNA repair dioxygenase AlkB